MDCIAERLIELQSWQVWRETSLKLFLLLNFGQMFSL